MANTKIETVDSTNFKLEIQPFEEDRVRYSFILKKRELYELYSQLRNIFPNEDQ